MPFPLAHPAAVLPLKRFCRAWLNLPGLVTGSVIPDAGYMLSRFKADELAHRPLGLVLFSLPLSLLLVALLYKTRKPFLALVPERTRKAFLPGTWQPARSALGIVVSVLIGAALHIAWDAFTHRGGWAAERLPFLNTVVGSFGGHTVRLCRLLWYASSFAGVTALYLTYMRALKSAGQCPQNARAEWLESAAVAAVVIPIELVHDMFRDGGGLAVAFLSLVLLSAVVWRTQERAGTNPLETG